MADGAFEEVWVMDRSLFGPAFMARPRRTNDLVAAAGRRVEKASRSSGGRSMVTPER